MKTRMKTRWIEVMIIVMGLGLLSLCFAAWDNDKPADTQTWNTAADSIRNNNDALEAELGIDLNEAHPYYQSAAPTTKPDTSTALDVDDNGRLWIDSDDNIVYILTDYSGITWTEINPVLVNDTYFTSVDNAGTGTVDLIKANTSDVAVLPDGSEMASSGAPTADADIANKKYVDDHGVIQVVNIQTGAVASNTTQIPHDDSIPQKTEGSEYMTLAITPTNSSNKLKIDIVFHLSVATGNRPTVIALFQDETVDAIACSSQGSDYPPRPICFTHYMTAGTTSETTFKVRAGTDAAATLTFNGFSGGRKLGGVMASSITITEIKV